ncbi:MAG TPA: LysR family transcriptional regulator [Terriglobales bacterium]|jgi:LysR family transcriptional regulator for metE and metH
MLINMDVKLEVRHLRLLAAVADTGSVTEAGRRLHLTQSALSHQLRDAEERLGTALFLRLGKRMVLTEAGQRLLVSARKVLDELRSTESQIEGMNGSARGVIRLSTECYTCYHWLPPVLKRFHSRFPKVDVRIDAEATHHALQCLLEGRLDVAIMVCTTPPRNKSLRITPMFEDEMLLVMAPDHPLASRTHINPRELEGETALIYPPREESTFIKVLREAGVEAGRVLEIPLTEAIIHLAASGSGVGFLARWAVMAHEDEGKVVARPLSSKGYRRQWHAVTLRNQPAPPYLLEFLEALSGHGPKPARRLA